MLYKALPLFLVAATASAQSSPRKCIERTAPECQFDGPEWDLMASVPGADTIRRGLQDYCVNGHAIGSNTGLLPEAADASVTGANIADGESGDTDFPFMDMKVLLSSGERSVCPESYGYLLTGVPDGMGAMLVDDDTVRVMYQSESYGPLRYESFPAPMNDGSFTMGGSRVQFVDYDRSLMAEFMAGDFAADEMVVGVGTMIEYAMNLKGEPIGPREPVGPTTVGAHYGNADAEGNYVVENLPMEADWFYQSFCSAHVEEKHQWAPGIGLEDDIYFTNEEWINYVPDSKFVGIGFHAIDIATKTAWAMGSTGMGGYEKLVEINSQNPDYVVLALSGYNGAFRGYDKVLEARNTEYTRTDGKNYTWTRDIHPARIYVGVKGKMEDGSDAPADDFLARNGLRYGAMYGYAVDMRPDNRAKGLWRDDFHRNATTAVNGGEVTGRWIKIPWMWDGTVRDFEHSDAWVYQDKPPFTSGSLEHYEWWTAAGPDMGGCKTEHLGTDPSVGVTGFVQTSTCGYFGHYWVEDIVEQLSAANGGLPNLFKGRYRIYQGETDVTDQILLGGKGQYANNTVDANYNWDDASAAPKATFEDIDGFEVLEGPEGKLYAIIQEDSGNDYGERMLLTSVLEHDRDGNDLSYYFLAMSGGSENTRIKNQVSVPAGTWSRATSHEFSGVFDLSGLLVKDDSGAFVLSASEDGYAKRAADRLVDINDKMIMVNLQAHSQNSGVLEAFQLDRGGQIFMIQPKNIA